MKKFTLSDFSEVLTSKSFVFTALFVISVTCALFYFQPGVAYEIVSNGEHVGYVKTKNQAEDTIKEMKNKIIEKKGSEATFKEDISFIKGRIGENEFTSKEVMQYNFEKSLDIKVPAYLIKKDDNFVMAVSNEEIANKVLNSAKSSYKKSTSETISSVNVSFVQDVKVVKFDNISESKVLSENEALALINPSTSVSRSNIRTLETASNKANLFDVKTTYREKTKVAVEPTVKRVPNANLYVGETKVETEGKPGVKEIISEISLVNGKQVGRKTVTYSIVKEPVEKVVQYGTKEKRTYSYRGNNGGKVAVSGDSSKVASIAMNYLGTPYVYGGTSTRGFDCSGFTQYVYRQVGVSLPRTSGSQSRVGQYVSLSELKSGDLLYGPGHVGIYIGGGQFIHAPAPGQRVRIQPISVFPNLRHGVRLVG